MRAGTLQANGLEFAYLEEGSGPLVLLLHGFPDDARTWSAVMPRLASAGCRTVAAFMRGYPPTEIPEAGFYDRATLVADAAALVEGLGGAPAVVVGHDWGADATYGLTAARPDLVRRAVALSVPPPGVSPQFLGSYHQIRRSFYMWFFQVPGLAEMAVPAGGFEFVRRLWREWSPGFDDPEQVANAIETLSRPGALEAALGYYRALFDPGRADPALEDLRRAMNRTPTVPVLALFGEDDGCIGSEFAEPSGEHLAPGSRIEILEGCGHFLHRERPEEVADLIRSWLEAT